MASRPRRRAVGTGNGAIAQYVKTHYPNIAEEAAAFYADDQRKRAAQMREKRRQQAHDRLQAKIDVLQKQVDALQKQQDALSPAEELEEALV